MVWLASAFDGSDFIGSPAIVVKSYEDLPRVFLFNEKANAEWLEDEDIGEGTVYDILYEGRIEPGVSGEWLVACDVDSILREHAKISR